MLNHQYDVHCIYSTLLNFAPGEGGSLRLYFIFLFIIVGGMMFLYMFIEINSIKELFSFKCFIMFIWKTHFFYFRCVEQWKRDLCNKKKIIKQPKKFYRFSNFDIVFSLRNYALRKPKSSAFSMRTVVHENWCKFRMNFPLMRWTRVVDMLPSPGVSIMGKWGLWICSNVYWLVLWTGNTSWCPP